MEIMTRFQPDGWTLRSLGQVFVERKEKGSDRDYPALSVTMNGIVPQLETAAKTDRGDDRKVVRVGDYVINSRSDRKGSGGISDLEGSVSLISIVMKPTDIEPKFAHHLLRSVAFQEEFYRFGRGIVADLWSTRYDDLKRIQVYLPPRSQQNRIASDLDRETARIDALIEKKTRFIELLKEKRQALITQAVTKGLDPTVPMKDSGVEWIGEVPAHWNTGRVKHVAAIKYGIGEPPKYRDSGTPLVRATNVKQGVINHEGMVYVDPADIPKQRIVWLQPGNIIVVRSGAYTADSAIIRTPDCPSIAGFDMVLTARGANPEFVHYALLSDYVKRDQLDQKKLRAAQPHLNAEELGDTEIVLPPLSEQREIIGRLSAALMKLEKLVQATVSSIGLLKERRSALITAAVTGQIDLRDEVA